MHFIKPLGQRLWARDIDRQVAELQVRIAVLHGHTALGLPLTEAVEQVCPGKGSIGYHMICETERPTCLSVTKTPSRVTCPVQTPAQPFGDCFLQDLATGITG